MTINYALLNDIRKQLLPSDSLEYISRKFKLELQERLQKSNTSMIVGGMVPRKKELEEAHWGSQSYLAIDFGGSTLKFALVTMPNCQILFRDAFDIPAQLINYDFFNTIVKSISITINKHLEERVGKAKFLVSTTFSFPLNDKLEIVTLGKGFEMSPEILNMSVKDIIALSFDRVLSELPDRKFDVEICDVINDSIAVYLTSRFMFKNESLSLILGTGVNSCFKMPLEKVPSEKQPDKIQCNCDCLINVEAGFLGRDIVNVTKFDHHDESVNMPLEEICSGKWLPLIFSNILKEYHINVFEYNSIDGEILIRIAEGKCQDIENDKLALVQEISKLLIQRAAFYVSAMLLAIASLVNNESINGKGLIEVGYVGSFLEHCTYYKNQIDLLSKNKIRLQFLHDSNLIGAAIATFLSRM